jgi:hypothetical protein
MNKATLAREAQQLVNSLVVIANSPSRRAWKAFRALEKAKDRRDRRTA